MPYRIDPSDSRCVQVQGANGAWSRQGCRNTAGEARAWMTALNINVTHKKIAQGEVCKLNEDRHTAFGYAYYARTPSGDQIVDHSKEFVPDPQNLEDVAYDFVLKSRKGDVMHDEQPVATLVESMVLTKEKAEAMGIPADGVPEAAWWVGFRVHDDDVWKRVKDGELGMFSIHGVGMVEEVEVPD